MHAIFKFERTDFLLTYDNGIFPLFFDSFWVIGLLRDMKRQEITERAINFFQLSFEKQVMGNNGSKMILKPAFVTTAAKKMLEAKHDPHGFKAFERRYWRCEILRKTKTHQIFTILMSKDLTQPFYLSQELSLALSNHCLSTLDQALSV